MKSADKPIDAPDTSKWSKWYWGVAIGLVIQILFYYALTILFS
ncbi:MAG TPA: hypothetical protein VFW78_10465 [Bacteroidia bacterium]|nr:hypothetical protein [Bacteroidia bacterium]